MEVELKRTKITKSIVDQSLTGSYGLMWMWNMDNNVIYEPLGWCVHNKVRKILIYNKIEKNILVLPYVLIHNGLEVYQEGVQIGSNEGGWTFPTIKHLKIKYCDINHNITLKEGITPQIDDVDKIHSKIKDFLSLVNQRGQIYL